MNLTTLSKYIFTVLRKNSMITRCFTSYSILNSNIAKSGSSNSLYLTWHDGQVVRPRNRNMKVMGSAPLPVEICKMIYTCR